MALTALTNSATVATDGNLAPAGMDRTGALRWEDRRDNVAAGFPTLWVTFKRPTEAGGVYRITERVITPVMETNLGPGINGVVPGPRVAYKPQTTIETLMPERATPGDRRVHLSYVISSLMRQLYASDLAPTQVTGAPFPDAVLTLTVPY